MEYCWKECLDRLKRNLEEYQTESLSKVPSFLFNIANKYVFGILDGYIWKIKFGREINLLFKIPDELDNENDKIIEGWNMYLGFNKDSNDDAKEINDKHSNIHLCIKFIQEIISDLLEFTEAVEQAKITSSKHKKELKTEPSDQDLIKWEIQTGYREIKLQVFKRINIINEWVLICTRVENFNFYYTNFLYEVKLLNDNDIILITEIGLFIYHFNEDNQYISLNYFNRMDLYTGDHFNSSRLLERLQYYKEVFSKTTLPLPNYKSFILNDEWISSVKDNKKILLKYGAELLSFAIKEHRLELIDEIYGNCMTHFKNDLRNNKMFLSIITSTLPLFNEYYPEYISRYSLETIMIVDSSFYNIEHQNSNLHLCSFQHPQIVNLTRSILWSKYQILMSKLF